MLPESNLNAPGTPTTKTSRSTKYVLIGAACVFVIVLSWFLFKDVFELQYYNIRYNEAHAGDKIYPAAWHFGKDDIVDVPIFRTAVPINSSGKRVAITSGWIISGNRLMKLKDRMIGYYRGDEMIELVFAKDSRKVIMAEISARRDVLERINNQDDLDLPKGYKYDDGPFYVMVEDISVHPPKKEQLSGY